MYTALQNFTPLFGLHVEQAALLQVAAEQDQQDHGDTHAADVCRYAQQLAQQLAGENAGEGTQGQEGHTKDDHCSCPFWLRRLQRAWRVLSR